MNEELQNYARNYIKEGLVQCTEVEQSFFKQLYSPFNMTKDINLVVDDMPEDKLNWAMQQVKLTLSRKVPEGEKKPES